MDLSPTVMTDDLCLTFGFFFYPEYASNNAQGPDMSASSNDNTFGLWPFRLPNITYGSSASDFFSSCKISLFVLETTPAQKLESLCLSCMQHPQPLYSDL